MDISRPWSLLRDISSHVTTGEEGSEQSGARFRPKDAPDDIEVMRLENSQDWSVDGIDIGSQSDSIAGLDDTKTNARIHSSDDVIVLEHKPAEWIDRNPEDLRKRKREEEGDDDVILLDTKPADWVERKQRR
ncbi:hypothetical protein BDR06DRAFT_1015187 [Suillus hirtellus]|nr:hypothetical protein BDR06DRAFT_1015187 [Suillus hirtellus]